MLGDLLKKKTKIKEWFKGRPSGRDIILGWKDPLPAFLIPIYLIGDFIVLRHTLRDIFQSKLVKSS